MVSDGKGKGQGLAGLPVVDDWWTVKQAAFYSGKTRQHINNLVPTFANVRRFGACGDYAGQIVLDPVEVMERFPNES